MNTEDIKEKYEKQKNTGIILIIVGSIIVVSESMIWRFFPIGIWVGIILFSIGLGFVFIHSRKTIEKLPVESQIELYAKRSKLKNKSGISLTVIGIALIIIGSLLRLDPLSRYLSTIFVGMVMSWLIGGILFRTGVGLLVHSVVLKKRMKKIEES